jgi:hypothetical protein
MWGTCSVHEFCGSPLPTNSLHKFCMLCITLWTRNIVIWIKNKENTCCRKNKWRLGMTVEPPRQHLSPSRWRLNLPSSPPPISLRFHPPCPCTHVEPPPVSTADQRNHIFLQIHMCYIILWVFSKIFDDRFQEFIFIEYQCFFFFYNI